MKLYETTFIINPQADDAALDRQVKAVNDLITQNGGKIVHEHRIGTRRLAYEIEGLIQGNYTAMYYESPAEVPAVLDRFFHLEDPYMRSMTLVFEGDIEAIKEGRSTGFIPEFTRGPRHGGGGGGYGEGRREGRHFDRDRDDHRPSDRHGDRDRPERRDRDSSDSPRGAGDRPANDSPPSPKRETEPQKENSEAPVETKPEVADNSASEETTRIKVDDNPTNSNEDEML